MFRNVNTLRRIVGALAVAAVLTAIPAEAAGSSRPAAPGFWESLVTWFGQWTGVGPVLGGPPSPPSAPREKVTGQVDEGPLIDPLGGLSGTRVTSIPVDPNGGQS